MKLRNALGRRLGVLVVAAGHRVGHRRPVHELARDARPAAARSCSSTAPYSIHAAASADRVVGHARLQLARHRVRIDLGHPVALPQQLHAEALLELLAAGRERHAEQRPQAMLRRLAAGAQQDRRQRPEHDPEGRAVVGDLLPVGPRREAALQMRRAAGVQRRVADDVQRRDVEQRQHRGQHVIRRVPLRVRDRRRVQVQEVVRVDDALRVARSSPTCTGSARPRTCRAARAAARSKPPSTIRGRTRPARAVHGLGQLGHRAGDDEQLDRARARRAPRSVSSRSPRTMIARTSERLDHALQQQPARVRVQRHGDAARRQHAVEGRHELDLVAQEQARRWPARRGPRAARCPPGAPRAAPSRTSAARRRRPRSTCRPAARAPARRARAASCATRSGSASRRRPASAPVPAQHLSLLRSRRGSRSPRTRRRPCSGSSRPARNQL